MRDEKEIKVTSTLEKLDTRSLDDRYMKFGGSVFMTGVQAIVRLMLDQQRLDHGRGLRTAAFVSGYEGSPLGGLDLELGRHPELLAEHDLVHRPAVNEELGATAILGSQLAPERPDASYEGVVGYWYGKAPGLDRATDALRHANLAGAHPRGGALALVGDDPLSKSSTLPTASEGALADLTMPTFYPADAQDLIELGLHAVALSRASGLWSAMKIVTNVADGGCDVALGENPFAPIFPDPAEHKSVFRHVVNSRLIGPVPLEQESSAFGPRLEIAHSYARLNGLNRLDSRSSDDRIGIVAAGKSYLDLLQALDRLGLDAAERARQGIRLLRLGMIFPLEPSIVTEFADGLDRIVVVEEKRPFVETAIKEVLYGKAGAPPVVGKKDDAGGSLIPATGELGPDLIAAALAGDLRRLDGLEDLPRRLTPTAPAVSLPLVPGQQTARTPYFCSGCPHNTSTQAPAGSAVGGGIGCHGMVLLMNPERVGDVVGLTQMGGEGSQWIGMSPFVDGDHLLQNIGDGTFHHSGSLALRATVAAGVNITYKLLYNSAVAMTGGQQAVGVRTVPEITHLLDAEGVAKTIITTEDPGRYRGVKLAKGAEVWHRERLEEAQEHLRGIAGVTVLVHDQECAIEKRRRRKRTPSAKPEPRIFINERVCEGCGDCGQKSNCLSVEPIDTEYGRKTRINQSSCNLDYSCLDGDCPSFLTVLPAKNGKKPSPPRSDETARPALPEPIAVVGEDEINIRMTGIGGTGVVTVAQVVAYAANIAGLHVRSLDQTGLSQKAGPVVSDIKISRSPVQGANKIGNGECDLYLGCDVLVAAEERNLLAADPARTVAVVSTDRVPTGKMVSDPDAQFPAVDDLTGPIRAAGRPGLGTFFDARGLAGRELGGDQFANVVMLGAAYQAGALPIPLTAVEEAIKLNGVAVQKNLAAFELGRRAALGEFDDDAAHESEGDLARVVRDRTDELIAYQSAEYARAYAEVIERVRAAEAEAVPESEELALAAAQNLYKVMAYKDEYEVARLSLDPQLRAQIEEQFGTGARIAWRLHPPVLRALGMRRKITVNGWWGDPLFRGLRGMRRLRGTKLDPFGYSRARQEERRIAREYRALLEDLAAGLSPGNHARSVEIASLPEMVRGYEDIKQDSIGRYEKRRGELLASLSELG
ncbi:MAG: indolepyruvate ferredoxin oxidoreductase family protein [Actinobacteria bacterium]|nr:indolepyruvate ferredoxin oxidoreductase family protein [Actinomycetota bacterium]